MSKTRLLTHTALTSLLIAGVVTLNIPSIALAGDYNTDTVVVTGTRQNTNIGDLAGNDSLISNDQIQYEAPVRPTEILNQVPGVSSERSTGIEHFTAIRSPAFNGGEGAGSFLYLEDGVPMRAAGFAEINGLGEANMEQAGSVEVVRGPGSALYGSNAMHGLINIIPRDPSKTFTNEIDATYGFVDGGRHDGSERLKATSSDTVDNLGLRLSAEEIHEDGWRNDTRLDQQKWVGRSVWTGGEDTLTTTFSGEKLDEQAGNYVVGTDSYMNNAAVINNQYYNTSGKYVDNSAYRRSTALRFMTRWQHDISDTAQLSVTPYARFVQSDFTMNYLPSQAIQKNEHTSGGVQTALYQTLAGGHHIIAGTDVEYTSGSYSEYQNLTTITSNGSPTYTQGWHYNLDATSTVAAPYIHSEWQVLDHTKVTAGARLESTTYDYTNHLADNSVGLFKRIGDRSDSFLTFTPKLGAVQQWSSTLANYVNLSVGGRAPQVTDLYELQTQQVVGQIKPENIKSVETGMRGNLGSLQYDTTAYYMTKDHYFYRDVSGLNVSNGQTLHRGLEALVKAPLGDGFDLGLAASYSLHTFEFTNTESVANLASASVRKGGLMPNAPREQGNMRLGYEWMKGARTEVEWQLVGSYVTDQANMHSYGGYSLFNLRGEIPIADGIFLHARVLNVTNVKYADRATVTTASQASASKDEYYPGQPLTVYTGVMVKF